MRWRRVHVPATLFAAPLLLLGCQNDSPTPPDGNGPTARCSATACAEHALCDDSTGEVLCTCASGYGGDPTVTCVDLDGCAANPCFAGVACTDVPAGDEATVGAAYVCDPCPGGYTGDGASCADIDECLTANGGCDPLTTCTNTIGGRACGACPAGYDGDGTSGCTDSDGCAVDPCFPGVLCTDVLAADEPTVGAPYRCGACPTGTAGDGESCTDIDACAGVTCYVGDCTDLPAPDPGTGYTCPSCPTGTEGDGETCTDIDACAGVTCYVGSCTDLPPPDPGTGYTCPPCPAGTEGDGEDCQAVLSCYSTAATVATVCNGFGSCVAPDRCRCIAGQHGSLCQAPGSVTCNAVAADSELVCSGHGVCSYQDHCECFPGFSGADCAVQFSGTCGGVAAGDPTACGGHGTCIAQDHCACDARHAGSDCSFETWSCAGGEQVDSTAFDFPGSSGCAEHGTCVAQDTCACEAGYYGWTCLFPIDGWDNCNGIPVNDPMVCSGRGDCLGGECTCWDAAIFSGVWCNVVLECNGIDPFSSTVCSGHGTCLRGAVAGECYCDDGFTGSDCETST